MKNDQLSDKFIEVFLTKNNIIIEHQVSSGKYKIDVSTIEAEQITVVYDPSSFIASIVFGNGLSIQLNENQRRKLKSCL